MFQRAIVTGVLVAAIAGSAFAARVDLWGQSTGFYDGNSNPLAPEVDELGNGNYQIGPTGVPTSVYVDLVFTISELGVGEYGIAGFSFSIGYPHVPGFKNWSVGVASFDPWDPIKATTDVPPSGWGFELDNSNWSGPSDPRLDMGKGSPECLLHINFEWDGLNPGTLSSYGVFYVVDDDGTGHIASDGWAGHVNGGAIAFIPEPATLSLLALGACLPLLRRRRRLGISNRASEALKASDSVV